MSQVQLTLRPPPNVDFVTGYPGIPPSGTDKPQAAVKGAVEVRVPTQGVKAQWVKVELRKVETLPGGGMANTFYDIIGPGPATMWTSGGAEYAMLTSQDFQFSIRIPESTPPSLQLEHQAGVHYELVATVSTTGKRGFFRKRKSTTWTTKAGVIIDKHDLHSVWPVYCQPETRHITQDAVKLIIDRKQSCYGPGDRISVTATLQSENLHTLILRGFEISLKETIAFRGHLFVAGKKGEPQTKTTIISENKFPVNTTMFGGTQITNELFCVLAAEHTNTTLTAARHIDITYVLTVKALMGTGPPLIMELPIIISNWQRVTSMEAVRRIGSAPGLSIFPTLTPSGINPLTQQPVTRVEPAPGRPGGQPATITPAQAPSRAGQLSTTSVLTDPHGHTPQQHSAFNRLPPTSSMSITEELASHGTSFGASGRNKKTHQTSNSQGSITGQTAVADDFGVWNKKPTAAAANINSVNAANAKQPDSESSVIPRTTAAQRRKDWLSAAEEKQILYEQAKARVEMVQGNVASTSPPPPAATPVPTTTQAKPLSNSHSNPWPTAEEEKLRLFNSAQAAVAKTQGYGYVPSATDPMSQSGSSSSKPLSAAAVMYSQAMSAVHRNDSTKATAPSPPAAGASTPNSNLKQPQSSSGLHGLAKFGGKVPGYMTAEEEKAALRRYEEAKQAVDRVQNSGYYADSPPPPGIGGSSGSDPISYDSLYPAHQQGSGSAAAGAAAGHMMERGGSPPLMNDLPPPFEATPALTAPQQLSEKERMRRAYEAQDAAALARQNSLVQQQQQQYHYQSGGSSPPQSPGSHPPPHPYATSSPQPPPAFSSGSNAYASAAAEKELLRRRFEVQDGPGNGMTRSGTPPQTPPRTGSAAGNTNSVGSFRSRPAPLPPVGGGSNQQQQQQRVLTAAEEKAMLKARYEAQDTMGMGMGVGMDAPSSPPPPMYVNGYGGGPNGLNSAGSGGMPSASSRSSGSMSALSYATMGTAVSPRLTSPPPLMPRPPQEYIKETQEEDARVARLTMMMPPPIEDGEEQEEQGGESSSGSGEMNSVVMHGPNGNGNGNMGTGMVGLVGGGASLTRKLTATTNGIGASPPPLPPKPVGE
ncbi:hypothetical protein AMATHDRAFT_71571 [Amanita thiersii Skay4041]|uniref:Arrestin C-terminal-like domain-containing protein n=1 Tax=Amanita thiersii Skay4041 TaxID=703135 RepID=A0A2A9NCV0_9AGAR|nr:hypothetical protein AMATHDRAFT_71571 [Amanita thiersii Skay4041]